MTEKPKTPEKTGTASGKKLSAQAIVSIIILVLMIIIPLVIYLWKQSEINNIRKDCDKRILEITAQANKTVEENNSKNMDMLTRVFLWAVRSELLRNNLEQIEQYMTDLVKSADLNNISLIKADGIVILSTDKKYEGNAYPGTIAREFAQINSVITKTGENGDLISICPVMGLDNRLGTIVITHTPKKNIFVAKENK